MEGPVPATPILQGSLFNEVEAKRALEELLTLRAKLGEASGEGGGIA